MRFSKFFRTNHLGTCVSGWHEFNNTCYYFNFKEDERGYWGTAKDNCEKVGASLVKVESYEENLFIGRNMPPEVEYWIGLSNQLGG